MSDRKIVTLIIDDEPIARQILCGYCSYIQEIELFAELDNALKAKESIEKNAIDLLFLDINMPVLDGMAFLKTLRNPPEVIFTTAYKEFALDAFDLSAIDYLLKPFSLDRFIVAVDKVKAKLATTQPSNLKGNANEFTFIKYEGKNYKINFDQLLFVEAQGNNIKIVVANFNFTPAMTFAAFEELLPKTRFSRIHRSFIINKTKINYIEGNRVL